MIACIEYTTHWLNDCWLPVYRTGSDITARLDHQKDQELKDKENRRMADSTSEDTVSRSTKTETGPGGNTTTTVTTTTHETKGTALVLDQFSNQSPLILLEGLNHCIALYFAMLYIQ